MPGCCASAAGSSPSGAWAPFGPPGQAGRPAARLGPSFPSIPPAPPPQLGLHPARGERPARGARGGRSARPPAFWARAPPDRAARRRMVGAKQTPPRDPDAAPQEPSSLQAIAAAFAGAKLALAKLEHPPTPAAELEPAVDV